MQEFIVSLVELSIPILALMIPIIAVSAHYVVKPLVTALTRLGEVQEQGPSGGRAGQVTAGELAGLEQRLAAVERALGRVLEEQEFQRELRIGPAGPAAVRAGADVEPRGEGDR